MRRARSEPIQRQSGDDRREPAAQVLDVGRIGSGDAQPGVLDRVVGLRHRTKHSVRHRSQVRSMGLESLGQEIGIRHRSRSACRLRQSVDDTKEANVTKDTPTMTTSRNHAPALVRWANPLTAGLLRLGLSMGPNGILTVRGRKSGELRTAPVAVLAYEGRRYLIGAYGDVQWTRNLRAAGEADFRLHGRTDHVTARELDREAATEFFRGHIRRLAPGMLVHVPDRRILCQFMQTISIISFVTA